MKIKNDFVTNSSSCSYILIGFKIDYDKFKERLKDGIIVNNKKINEFYDFHEKCYYENISCMNGSDDGISDDNILIGKKFDIHDDECIEYQEIDLNNVSNLLEPIMSQLNIKKEDIKIYTSTRLC